jgi:hypothetical protein
MKIPGLLLCLTLPLAALDQRYSERVKLSGDMSVSVYISGGIGEPKEAQVVFIRPGDAPPLKAAVTGLKLLDAAGKEVLCHLSNQGDGLLAGHGLENTTDALACYEIDTDDVKKIVSATVTQGGEHTQVLPLSDEDPNPHLDGSRLSQTGKFGIFVSVQPGKDSGVVVQIGIPAISTVRIPSVDFGLMLIDSKGKELKPQPLDQREFLSMVSTMSVRTNDGTAAAAGTAFVMYKLDGVTPADLAEAWPSYRGEIVKLKFITPPLSASEGD